MSDAPCNEAEPSASGSTSNYASPTHVSPYDAAALPRVHILNSTYASHRRAAEGYRELLRKLDCETHRLGEADVVICHTEAVNLPGLLRSQPALAQKYLINICVWETSEMPREFIAGLSLVDEVWTPSSYCAGILYKHHFVAHWLPHVTESRELVELPAYVFAYAEKLLGIGQSSPAGRMLGAQMGRERFDVLTVTKREDPRKNNELLIEAFEALRRRCPHARLIIKGGSWLPLHERSYYVDGATLIIDQPASDAVMLALMLRCQLVATASHAEGWGLTLAQAMAHGVPVVAPNYSGPMTYLSRRNSLLTPASEGPIAAHWGWFRPPARWGYCDRIALEENLVRAYEEHNTAAEELRKACARRDIEAFGPQAVERLLFLHLRRIKKALQRGWRAPTQYNAEDARPGALGMQRLLRQARAGAHAATSSSNESRG